MKVFSGMRGKVKKLLAACLALFMALAFAACSGTPANTAPASVPAAETGQITAEVAAPAGETEKPAQETENSVQEIENPAQEIEKTLRLLIGETEVPVEWEDNASVGALIELVESGPLTVSMSMYGGFEQVGPLGTDLPRDDAQTSADYGDIVLYSGDQIVIFYGSNSWSYTRLGHIGLSKQEMTDLLSAGNVNITLKYE
ncbi:MAG: hypothetical protein II784_05605 [Oscillospiraceae bacterium]|nr:hypothetical protein [Oscillospiraceae bacterium]